MGLYIKNMDMPETGEYRCIIRQWEQGKPITIDLYGAEELSGTIISVPPHGRLGDLDELAEGCDEPYWCRWLSEIQDAPTIIPADKEVEA